MASRKFAEYQEETRVYKGTHNHDSVSPSQVVFFSRHDLLCTCDLSPFCQSQYSCSDKEDRARKNTKGRSLQEGQPQVLCFRRDLLCTCDLSPFCQSHFMFRQRRACHAQPKEGPSRKARQHSDVEQVHRKSRPRCRAHVRCHTPPVTIFMFRPRRPCRAPSYAHLSRHAWHL